MTATSRAMRHGRSTSSPRSPSAVDLLASNSIGWIADRAGVSDYAGGKVPLTCLDRLRDDLPRSQPAGPSFKFDCSICKHDSVKEVFTSSVIWILAYWVPGEAGVFVAPGNLVHLIYDHDYQPPRAFVEAVLTSPRVGSLAFADRLRPSIGAELYENLVRRWEERRKRSAIDIGSGSLCRYCETRLRSDRARQCLCCHLDWHDETQISLAGKPVLDTRILSLF